MIDAKKIEELISRKTELLAEIEVYIAIGDFISSNMDRCQNERSDSEWQAWMDALNEVTAKLKALDENLKDILTQLKEIS